MASTITTIEPPSLGAVSVSRERVLWIDIARCIGLWLMVVGHLAEFNEDCDFIYGVIYSFHMPLFFILAGTLFHPAGVKGRIKKDFRKLLFPSWALTTVVLIYFHCNGLAPKGTLNHTILWYLLHYTFCSQHLFDLCVGICSLWFIGALVLVHLTMELLWDNKKWLMVVIAVAAYCGAKVIGDHPWECMWLRILPIGSAMMALAFTVFGFLLKEWLLAEKSWTELALWIILGATAIWATVTFNGEITNINNEVFGDSILLCFVGGIGGSLMMFGIAQLMERKITFPKWVFSVINDIAYGAVIIILWQFMLGDIWYKIFPDTLEVMGRVPGSMCCVLFCFGFQILITRFLRRYAPWFLG